MKKTFCKHSGCNYFYNLNDNGFCSTHQEELDNSGKEGYWKCTWCEEWKQMGEDMLRSRFDVGSGVNLE